MSHIRNRALMVLVAGDVHFLKAISKSFGAGTF